MRGRLANTGRHRRSRVWVHVLPALLLPFSIAGVVVGPAWETMASRRELDAAEERVERAGRAQRALAELGGASEEGAMRAELECLRSLVPTRLDLLDVYSWIRLAAARHSLELDAIVPHEEAEAGPPSADAGGYALLRVEITGHTSLSGLVRFGDELRDLGLPHAVLALDLAQALGSERYSMHLRLGFFVHPSAAPSASAARQEFP